MAQATGGYNAANAKVEYSANGSTWTSDWSGFAASVKEIVQQRAIGERYTHDGDTAIVTAGKRQPIRLRVNILMTEGTGDPFEVLRAAFEAKTAIYLRYSPKGGAVSTFLFTSDAGQIAELQYPETDAEDASPAMVSFVFVTPKLTKALVTT